jgi:precorrin-2 dehydrogenase/sirohydrochlorin ferrochelatase
LKGWELFCHARAGGQPDFLAKQIQQIMKYYPVHLDIKNRNCLVVGGGAVGTRKVNTLLECGARVTVVSPNPTPQLTKLASEGAIILTRRAYRSADLDGAFLVIGASDDESLNQQISNDAALTNSLCNIADRPEACNFILPSIIQRGDLVITISTSGKSPALAKQLRQKLETQFGKEYAEFLLLMGVIRKKLLSRAHAPEAHKTLFNHLIDSDLIQLMQAGKTKEINSLLYKILGEGYKIEELL